jgi:hypothetical protein
MIAHNDWLAALFQGGGQVGSDKTGGTSNDNHRRGSFDQYV